VTSLSIQFFLLPDRCFNKLSRGRNCFGRFSNSCRHSFSLFFIFRSFAPRSRPSRLLHDFTIKSLITQSLSVPTEVFLSCRKPGEAKGYSASAVVFVGAVVTSFPPCARIPRKGPYAPRPPFKPSFPVLTDSPSLDRQTYSRRSCFQLDNVFR